MFEIIDVDKSFLSGMCFDLNGDEIFPCASFGSTREVVCFTTTQSFVLVCNGKQIAAKPNMNHDWSKFPCVAKGKK